MNEIENRIQVVFSLKTMFLYSIFNISKIIKMKNGFLEIYLLSLFFNNYIFLRNFYKSVLGKMNIHKMFVNKYNF